jgi:D-3-phosphoglycerate dehydrogenase
MMKPTAILVNTARGGIIDEKALYDALSSKKIRGAALDVTEQEPPVGSPLLTLDNIIVTSHIGGYTQDAVRNMGVMAASNAAAVLTGKPCDNIVTVK